MKSGVPSMSEYFLSLLPALPGMPENTYAQAGIALAAVFLLFLFVKSLRRRFRRHRNDEMIFAAESEVNVPELKL